MSYYLTKSNPNKWRLLDYLIDIGTANPEWWSDVCKGTKPGDTLFIGLSGQEAGIYARATITSYPYFDTPDQEYAVPPGSAKERRGADTDSFQNLISRPILEANLRRIPELNRITNWLHSQGGVCQLTPDEAATLDRLIGSR